MTSRTALAFFLLALSGSLWSPARAADSSTAPPTGPNKGHKATEASAKKILRIFRANTDGLKPFPATRADMEAKYNESTEFLNESPVKEFAPVVLRTYGIKDNGEVVSRFYMYGSSDGAIYGYVMETSGGIAKPVQINSDVTIHPLTVGIASVITNLDHVDSESWGDEMKSLYTSGEMLCEMLKKQGHEEDGFTFSNVHVRGWKRGELVTLEFVPTAAWTAYKAKRFQKPNEK
jgi:hypothetical protein